MNRIHYIYKITNLVNNKIYIGQTVNISKRWSQHQTSVKNNKPTQVVHNAMIKYGTDNFKFEIVASCLDQDAANDTEEIIIKQENSQICGYNISNGGSVAPKTEIWKKYMSRIMSGRPKSEDIRQKISKSLTGKYIGEKHPMYGKKHTEAIKIIIKYKRSLQKSSRIGIKNSEKTRELISINNLGKSRNKGENNGHAKINLQLANQIREEYKSKNITYKQLAEKYNICIANICGIINNKKWKYE